MSTAVRLDRALLERVRTEARSSKRSVTKQVEYWVEIGQAVCAELGPSDILALRHGLAKLKVEVPDTTPVGSTEIIEELEQDRAAGRLRAGVTAAKIVYEVDPTKPGALVRIDESGERVPGTFVEGAFVKEADAQIR